MRVHEVDGDAESRQQVSKQREGSSVQLGARHHPVSGRGKGGDHPVDGGHSGGEGIGGLGALEVGDEALERRDGRVAKPSRVAEPRSAEGQDVGELLRRVESPRGCLVQRNARRSLLDPRRAGPVDGPGGESLLRLLRHPAEISRSREVRLRGPCAFQIMSVIQCVEPAVLLGGCSRARDRSTTTCSKDSWFPVPYE